MGGTWRASLLANTSEADSGLESSVRHRFLELSLPASEMIA
jgi:hypothetical protein